MRAPHPSLAASRHAAATLGPTTGTRSTNAGGGGIVASCSDFVQAPTSSEYSARVLIATQNGSTNTRSITRIIAAIAGARLPPSQRCTETSSGHVATTTIVAQISATRNGRMIQNDAAMSPPIDSTASVVRVTSLCMIASRLLYCLACGLVLHQFPNFVVEIAAPTDVVLIRPSRGVLQFRNVPDRFRDEPIPLTPWVRAVVDPADLDFDRIERACRNLHLFPSKDFAVKRRHGLPVGLVAPSGNHFLFPGLSDSQRECVFGVVGVR